MSNPTALTREQELEILFLAFIKEVVRMRRYQTEFDTKFGADYKKKKYSSQEKVDGIIAGFGITEQTDLTEIKRIVILKEKLG